MRIKTRVVSVRTRTRAGKIALAAFKDDDSKFDNGTMQVGIVDNELTYPDGTGVADVAMWNEFGTDTIPSRPALRQAIKDATPELVKLGAKHAQLMLQGKMRFDYSARILARLLVQYMKDSITRWDTPSNAPSTIALKGKNDPLMDTGLYRDSISFKLLKTRKDQL